MLIGASTYINLPPSKSLRAPGNDVRRMQATLRALGVRDEDIAIYADGVEGSRADPTAAVILQAFNALPGSVAADDQVVIYMSGHGTQIPDDDGDEDDGFDEAFLPVDAVPPPAGAERFDMTNVIRDDRIGGLIDALRQKGAHIWLVVDSCHSGTISRAATEEARAKELSPADFGLPPPVPRNAATTPPPSQRNLGDTKRNSATGGSLTAFYASQSDEISLELAVPRGAAPEQQTWVSAFTDALVGVLARGGAASYRDLLDETARQMRAQIPPRTRQTPGHDGDGMDRRVLGGAAERAPGFSIDGDRIAGGLIVGLEPGTVVALYDRAGDAPIGHAQVVNADALTAKVIPVAFPCTQQAGTPICETQPAGDIFARARTARPATPVTRMTLRVSQPRDWPTRPSGTVHTEIETRALALIRADAAYAIDDQKPDFIWYRTPDGMRFVPSWIPASDEEFGPAASLKDAPADEAASRIAAALDRARTLMRLERVRAALPSNALPIGVATAKTALVRYGRDQNGRCRFAGGRETLAANTPVQTCDGASVQIRNGGTVPVFAYVFSLDDSWVLHPLGNSCRQGAQNRIDVGGARTVDLQYRNGTIEPGMAARTRNGVVVFAVPFEPGVALPFDPCQLVRATGNKTRSAKGDGDTDPVDALLGRRTDTRSTGGAAALGQLVMSVETWAVDQSRQ